jgi:hypothetical protein
MHLTICFLSYLAALAVAAPQAIDYGPCDYNGNDNCKEIMDNTACFLNPVGANEIFKCISGGRDGVRRPLSIWQPLLTIADTPRFAHATDVSDTRPSARSSQSLVLAREWKSISGCVTRTSTYFGDS